MSFLDPDTLHVAIVWVGFEDSASCDAYLLPDALSLPSFFRRVETDLEDYMAWQSYGKLIVEATTIQGAGADSLKSWNLGKTPCYWKTLMPCSGLPDTTICRGAAGAEGCVNRHVVDMIADSLGTDVFDGLDRVCFIHLGSAFSCEWYAGWGTIRYSCDDCAYSGSGTVQRPIVGVTSGDEGGTKWMLAHEFGHTLGLDHTPNSEQEQGVNTVYFGRYSPMQLGAP